MYGKNDLIKHIESIGIKPDDTLMIHSSMKAIGEVDGGADTVLDAFIEYLRDDGLLIFPTHTWATINSDNNIYDPVKEPSCVGLLTNMFMKRPDTHRSLHITHSVTALGKDAAEYTTGEEFADTPCPRSGCWGRLYDRKAKILFLGCTLKRNTFLHSVEEWNDIPDRLTAEHSPYKIVMPDGTLYDRPMRRHYSTRSSDISANCDKVENIFLNKKAAVKNFIGDADSYLCDAVMMGDIVSELLAKNPNMFADGNPID